ncbi:MAG: hypothetical protein KKG75_03575 [Nanoarchaeota archaeon]|nr:hypothetical protein [Nanoarchaeota archaeon]
MIRLNRRRVEVDGSKIIVDGYEYDRKLGDLPISEGASPGEYALVFINDEARDALSMQQQLNGLKFYPMNRRALEQGLPLARVKDFTPFHRNVNLALQEKGVLYDASGNLINGERLAEVGNAVNNAWVYLNDGYKQSTPGNKGFLDLDLVHVAGFDGEKPIVEHQPLEECVVDCWADTEEVNEQGYYTKKAPIQKFEQGKTVYVWEPLAGRVARFSAGSFWAFLNCLRNPLYSVASLGGFLRAEGTAPENTRRK